MNPFLARIPRLLVLLGASAAASVAPAAGPPPLRLERTLNSPFPASPENFGWSLDTFNDNLLVGSYGGRVYVVNPATGAHLLRIQSPEGFGSFGRSVTQFGDLIAVGAPELGISPYASVGSAYLFDGTTGAHVRTLRNPNPANFGWFGSSMEEAAGKLFVSSDSASGNASGRVYAYDSNSATPIGSLVNPQANFSSAWGFGFAMAERQADLFVSAPGHYTGSNETGRIYRYDAATLARELTIINPSPGPGAIFGRSLSVSATQLLVGAPGRSVGGVAGAGAAYLFNADTGALLQTFLNPEPQEFASFGESVALFGKYAVVGTPLYWPKPGQFPAFTGAAFIFDVNTGALVARLDSPSPGQNEYFTTGDGSTMRAVGKRLAVSHVFNNSQAGTVYLFVVPEPGSAGLLAVVGALGVFPRPRPLTRRRTQTTPRSAPPNFDTPKTARSAAASTPSPSR